MTRATNVGFCVCLILFGCSAAGTSRALVVGTEGAGGASAGTGGTGAIFGAADASASNPLSARIQSPPGVTVTFVTLSCTKRCADVLAVAQGGVGPYTYAWADGSTDRERTVCPDATTQYSVTVKDTGSSSGEFGKTPSSATAALTANVIVCPPNSDAGKDAGGPASEAGSPLPGCAPFRAIAAVPSQATPSTPVLAGYVSESVFSVVVIAHADLSLSLNPACPHLLLAGDSAGTKPVSWDDDLLVESRSAPGAPDDSRVYYGSPPLTYGGQPVKQTVEPTGGFAPLTIDLTSRLSPGQSTVDLTLSILDQGFVGSTTDIWVIPK